MDKKKVLIFGAGSIGNHMTYASINLGYKVFITDKSQTALNRMKKLIYKKRYGNWNKEITEKVVWPKISSTITRLKPFIKFNETECKMIMKDVFV